MESPSKCWQLVLVYDVNDHRVTQLDSIWQYLTNLKLPSLSLVKLIFGKKHVPYHSAIGPIGSQGCTGIQGAQGPAGAQGYVGPYQEDPQIQRMRTATKRDLLNELAKGIKADLKLFGANYYFRPFLMLVDQILLKEDLFVEDKENLFDPIGVSCCQFFFPEFDRGYYFTNRQDRDETLKFGLRYNQPGIYYCPIEIRIIVDYLNSVLGLNLDLPSFACQCLDFDTEDQYLLFRQEEIQRQQQAQAEFDRKYRVTSWLTLEPGKTCEITGRIETCVIVEGDDGYRTISLNYLMEQAAQRELPFGKQKST